MIRARFKMRVFVGMGLLALLVAPWAFAQGFFRVAPGPLSESHAEFDNNEGCPKCHLSNAGVTNAKCLDCHKPLRERIAKKSGLHATFTGNCFTCHPGHKGRAPSIIDWKHVGGQQTFDHKRTQRQSLAIGVHRLPHQAHEVGPHHLPGPGPRLR
jgi:hypothetical protein